MLFRSQSTALSWTSSENINLVSGKSYYINGVPVLSQTALSSNVTSAPGLNSIGILTSLQVSNLNVVNASISFNNPAITDGTIILSPKNAGTVDVDTSRITSVSSAINPTDAVNLTDLQTAVKEAPLGLACDTTLLSNTQIASTIITPVYPPSEHVNGTLCRIHCIDSGVRTTKVYQLISGAWSWQTDL